MPDLLGEFTLNPNSLGHLTSAVQFGFITGTLSLAILTIADRFSPSKVFFICAVIGAFINLGILLENNSILSLVVLRFLTGFSLAGIYPVGMKIASDYFDKGLGKSLGYVVGALVLGTAFPHLLKYLSGDHELDWRWVIYFTSAISVLGGLLILLWVPNGPFRKEKNKPELDLIFRIFQVRNFRSAAFGYFGHMWELYAFWAFIPVILNFYKEYHSEADFSVPFISFLVIGIGALACIAGGYISEFAGVKKTAAGALFLSGLCCLISPVIFFQDSEILLICFLLLWGMVVVADSPLFSTLVAQNSSSQARGTALTIVNSIGFSITIFSIQLLNLLVFKLSNGWIFICLSLGPVFGLLALFRKRN